MQDQQRYTQAAKLAYEPQDSAADKYGEAGWSICQPLYLEELATTEAYFLSDGDRYCIAIRGSDDLGDWLLRNLWAKSSTTGWGCCHGGILDSAKTICNSLSLLARFLPEPKRLVFCGHSQGGSAALLLVALAVPRMRAAGWSVRPEVLALGAPPACSKALAEAISREADVTVIAHPHDPIPCFAPPFSGWCNPGAEPRPMPWRELRHWGQAHVWGYWAQD